MRIGQVVAGGFLTCVGLAPLIIHPKGTLLPVFGERVGVQMLDAGGDRQVPYGYHQTYVFEYQGQKRQFEMAYATSGPGTQVEQVFVWPTDIDVYGPVSSEETWMWFLVMAGTLPIAIPTLTIGLCRKKEAQQTRAPNPDPASTPSG